MSIKEKKILFLLFLLFAELKNALQLLEPKIMQLIDKKDNFLGKTYALVTTAKA